MIYILIIIIIYYYYNYYFTFLRLENLATLNNINLCCLEVHDVMTSFEPAVAMSP